MGTVKIRFRRWTEENRRRKGFHWFTALDCWNNLLISALSVSTGRNFCVMIEIIWKTKTYLILKGSRVETCFRICCCVLCKSYFIWMTSLDIWFKLSSLIFFSLRTLGNSQVEESHKVRWWPLHYQQTCMKRRDITNKTILHLLRVLSFFSLVIPRRTWRARRRCSSGGYSATTTQRPCISVRRFTTSTLPRNGGVQSKVSISYTQWFFSQRNSDPSRKWIEEKSPKKKNIILLIMIRYFTLRGLLLDSWIVPS